MTSPIAHGHPIAQKHDLPTDFEWWQRQCIDLLERCDELYVLIIPGWRDSRGVQAEIEHACNLDMPVTHYHMSP